MAALNEAYRVLGDPGRRALYDRALDGGASGSAAGSTAGSSAAGAGTTASSDEDLIATIRRTTYNYDAPSPRPARIPWRFLGVIGAIGIGAVLLGAAFIDGPTEPEPDGVIRTGSCVEVLPNSDVREVRCDGAGDLVVDRLVPLDARCPGGTTPHRDQLGLGVACVLPPASADPAAGSVG